MTTAFLDEPSLLDSAGIQYVSTLLASLPVDVRERRQISAISPAVVHALHLLKNRFRGSVSLTHRHTFLGRMLKIRLEKLMTDRGTIPTGPRIPFSRINARP